MNDYHAEFETIMGCRDDPRRYSGRTKLVRKYGFAIPSDEAVKILVDLSPVIEVGAGGGYWAHLILRMGGTIRAFDPCPLEENEYRFEQLWFNVQIGGVEVLESAPEPTLFLCWPCYQRPWATKALKAFKGERLVFIGEGQGGCTGDDEFHQILEKDWEEMEYIFIPRWPGIHDAMHVLERK